MKLSRTRTTLLFWALCFPWALFRGLIPNQPASRRRDVVWTTPDGAELRTWVPAT